jgi:hypothetical protein
MELSKIGDDRPGRIGYHLCGGWLAGSLADNYERLARSNASHAARLVARHRVGAHAVPVALVGLCSMPVV